MEKCVAPFSFALSFVLIAASSGCVADVGSHGSGTGGEGGGPGPGAAGGGAGRIGGAGGAPGGSIGGSIGSAGGGGLPGGSSGGAGGLAGSGGAAPVPCTADITAMVLANQSVTLAGDSCVSLPVGNTQYDGVLSGSGTLRIQAPSGSGTLILTADSTYSLPVARQTETARPTDPNHVHYFSIQNPNPAALFIDPGVTLRLGTPTSTTGTIGNYIPNTNGTTINLDNYEVNGTLVLESGPVQHLGILSGAGIISRPSIGTTGGTLFMVGDSPFSGVYSQFFGGYFGSDHVIFSLPNATIFSNESFIVAAPEGQFGATAGHLLKFPQTIWEGHYGDDINTNSGHIVFAGVYSYSNSGDPLKPLLTDPRLNTMLVQNVAGSPTGGNNSSFRGINIEGGNTDWGDGTTATFFLPSAPSPAAPDSTVKNSYINLHNNSTMTFNYNGRYTCSIGITGGGGGPRADGSVGVGNLTIAATAGNYAVLTMPQNYNGTTTIGAGATLQLGNGGPVQAMTARVGAPTAAEPHGAVTAIVPGVSYTGDSSLLTAESPTGAATDAIVNGGHLIVNNTTTPITLSHISGAGTFTQAGPANGRGEIGPGWKELDCGSGEAQGGAEDGPCKAASPTAVPGEHEADDPAGRQRTRISRQSGRRHGSRGGEPPVPPGAGVSQARDHPGQRRQPGQVEGVRGHPQRIAGETVAEGRRSGRRPGHA